MVIPDVKAAVDGTKTEGKVEAETTEGKSASRDLLDGEEASALLAYKSGGSYSLNAKLREKISLNKYEQRTVDGLDKALEKLPIYKGEVYRNISFDGLGDKAARDSYVAGHIVGDLVVYEAYISSSTSLEGYPIDGDFVVHHVIQSLSEKNLDGYGNNAESEVLFPRESQFITQKITYDV